MKNEANEGLKTYYFTFGSYGQVFDGGWVEIHANSIAEAQRKFINRYGDMAWKYDKACLNYSFHYTEDEFKKTEMYEGGSNHGTGCHEVII